jgi:ABC-type transport system involved in multi-copper enzyme maturation permease subunit
MIGQMTKTVGTILSPARLTGPIFDKELRVSSRRRRSYSLRSFYILALTVFVAVVWTSVVDVQGNATVQQAHMAEAGKWIISTIVVFQFIAMQLLAVIMLSNAVSDEVYHRTLGLLMTTPITGLQIVMGKVLSRLLQLILLLAITFPILAILRVLGGVSWDYLLSSVCITLAAAIFAGSLSLLMSIRSRRAYVVILRTMFLLGCFYLVLPVFAGVSWGRGVSAFAAGQSFHQWLCTLIVIHLNPVVGLVTTTWQMLSATRGTVMPYSWPLQCVCLLGASVLVLAWATVVVRKVALRQATGQLDAWFQPRRRRRRVRELAATVAEDRALGEIKRVQGPPVVWRELRAPFIAGVDNRNSYIGLGITVAALLLTYLSSAQSRVLDYDFVQTTYVLLFLFLGTIVNAVFAATRITSEKETQSWMLLLATPLSDAEILLGKAISTIRRCVPIWGLLAGHVLLFVVIGYIHVVAVIHLLMLVVWITVFVTGAGLYFSARFARTTSAVVATFGLILGLWVAGPILAGVFSTISPRSSLPGAYLLTHPTVQATIIMDGAGGRENAHIPWRDLEYRTDHRRGQEPIGMGGMTCILSVISASYIFVGLLLFWWAGRHLRRHVFI